MERLESVGLVAPVVHGGEEERLWLDCDLASLAEHRLGDDTDPSQLTDARRDDWIARATRDLPRSLDARERFTRCYWLLDDGRRVGTLAVDRSSQGRSDVRVSSFYVFRALRGRGVGQRALRRLATALGTMNLGYRLDTCWAWQRTVRFYLRAGLWLHMWKRDLTFCTRDGLPKPVVDVGDDAITLSAVHGDERVVLAVGRRDGDALVLESRDRRSWEGTAFHEVAWDATTTLALALALEGRPMVRSDVSLRRARACDAGAPEGLAHRIPLWEAFDRAQGWRVETPRVPGVRYPTWAEFEAEWEVEDAP